MKLQYRPEAFTPRTPCVGAFRAVTHWSPPNQNPGAANGYNLKILKTKVEKYSNNYYMTYSVIYTDPPTHHTLKIRHKVDDPKTRKIWNFVLHASSKIHFGT